MKASHDSPVIALLGHYGNQNLGDEAIITALIQQLGRLLPEARVVCFTIDPADARMRHKAPAVPIRRSGETRSPGARVSQAGANAADRRGREPGTGVAESFARRVKAKLKGVSLLRWLGRHLLALLGLPGLVTAELGFLARSYRRLEDIDLVLVAGSNQFLDNFGGPWAFPYTLLKWAVLSKLAGKRVIFVSVGAGPIHSRWSKWLIRCSLLFSSYTSFRDEPSRALIETSGRRSKGRVFPDLAFSLETMRVEHAGRRRGWLSRKPLVAINPMAVYDSRYWYVDDATKYAGYVGKLASFAATLLREGYPLAFFATQPKDENVIEDLLVELSGLGFEPTALRKLVRYSRDVYELMSILLDSDLVVATRFHGTVLALLAQKPVVGLCYYRKAADLLAAAGQGRYALNLDDFEVDELLGRFRCLEENRRAEAAQISRYVADCRQALEAQYGAIVGLLAQGRGMRPGLSIASAPRDWSTSL